MSSSTQEQSAVAARKNSPRAHSLAAELQSPATHGQRHSQMKRTILPLIDIGLCDTAIFAQYRQMYDANVPDSEIADIIKWGRLKSDSNFNPPPSQKHVTSPEQKIRNALDWLGAERIEPADLWDASQLQVEEDSDAILYLSLYEPADYVTINARYIMRKLSDGSQKAELCGPGQTRRASQWVEDIRTKGVPQGRAGVWVRINPLRAPNGGTPSGAHTDADVLRYSKLLVESDILPFEIALSLFAKVRLPICAIVDSAGRGPHAVVALEAANAEDYAQKAAAIFKGLEPLGIDPGNANPSRYSRLAGAKRVIGARPEVSIQKLLYIAQKPNLGGIFP